VRRLAAAVASVLASAASVAVRVAGAYLDCRAAAARSAYIARAFARYMQAAVRSARASCDALRTCARVIHVSLMPRAVSRALASAA
jgi:hypothetical protein